MTYTELRWWMTDYAPFDKVLQTRVVERNTARPKLSVTITPLTGWTIVPTANMPKPYERPTLARNKATLPYRGDEIC